MTFDDSLYATLPVYTLLPLSALLRQQDLLFCYSLELYNPSVDMFTKHRHNAAKSEDQMARPANPLQTDFETASSVDTDEQYLVRAEP